MNQEIGKVIGELSKEMGQVFGGLGTLGKKRSQAKELVLDERPWEKPGQCRDLI